jgi:hypothetical protein
MKLQTSAVLIVAAMGGAVSAQDSRGSANTAAVEAIQDRWACYSFIDFDMRGEVKVHATVYKNGRGLIEAAGTQFPARFEQDGFDKAWRWETSSNQYAFIIDTDGRGAYYRFDDKDFAKPQDLFNCKQERLR